MAFLNVKFTLFVEWMHRNDDNAQESFNELTVFIVEHLPHVLGTVTP